jgi:hypothetical protein
MRTRAWGLSAALLALLSFGCASEPYVPLAVEPETTLAFRPGEARVERGRPHALVDGLGHYLFSLPAKLALLSWRVENHRVSPETETALLAYLDENALCRVKVRINQYAPGGEWSRLFRNRDVHGFWRYTFGFLTVLGYTVLPQRVFGGDNYNPFTNTISIYSDLTAITQHEGGHAKDFAERDWKGPYAAVRILPIVPLFQEGIATGDAVSYLRAEDPPAEKPAYPLLWGAWGTYVGGEASWLVDGPILYAITIPAAWIGRGVGTVRAWTLPDPPPPAPAAGEPPPSEPAPAEPEPEVPCPSQGAPIGDVLP